MQHHCFAHAQEEDGDLDPRRRRAQELHAAGRAAARSDPRRADARLRHRRAVLRRPGRQRRALARAPRARGTPGARSPRRACSTARMYVHADVTAVFPWLTYALLSDATVHNASTAASTTRATAAVTTLQREVDKRRKQLASTTDRRCRGRVRSEEMSVTLAHASQSRRATRSRARNERSCARRAPRARTSRSTDANRSPSGPLAGVPYMLKDTWDTPASRRRAARGVTAPACRPSRAACSSRCRRRAPCCSASRTCCDLAFSRESDNHLVGPTRNPHRRDAHGGRQHGRRRGGGRERAWRRSTGAPTSAARSASPRRSAASSGCGCRASRGRSSGALPAHLAALLVVLRHGPAHARRRDGAHRVLARSRRRCARTTSGARSTRTRVFLYSPDDAHSRSLADFERDARGAAGARRARRPLGSRPAARRAEVNDVFNGYLSSHFYEFVGGEELVDPRGARGDVARGALERATRQAPAPDERVALRARRARQARALPTDRAAGRAARSAPRVPPRARGTRGRLLVVADDDRAPAQARPRRPCACARRRSRCSAT